jgi:Circularly permutated YpsA SLOG family
MITLVFSGGQTGADQAGWRAAEACGIATGGWMPKGFLTEEGPQRWFANVYGAREMPTANYPARTVQNVKDSDGTLWFGSTYSPGAKTTLEACERLRKPVMLITPSEVVLASDVVAWLRRNPQIERLNIAGNRESKNPGIGGRVERVLDGGFQENPRAPCSTCLTRRNAVQPTVGHWEAAYSFGQHPYRLRIRWIVKSALAQPRVRRVVHGRASLSTWFLNETHGD